MNIRWIGALFVVVSCGWFGFSSASLDRNEVSLLRHLNSAAEIMECELSYRLTPLPELCRKAGNTAGRTIRRILNNLAIELEKQSIPDVESGMLITLAKEELLPRSVYKILRSMGSSLGRYDLPGQIKGLEAIRESCQSELKNLDLNREERTRGYQTIGLCAGTALAILFI